MPVNGKITPRQLRHIQRLQDKGLTYKEIAARYGVTPSAIGYRLKGRRRAQAHAARAQAHAAQRALTHDAVLHLEAAAAALKGRPASSLSEAELHAMLAFNALKSEAGGA